MYKQNSSFSNTRSLYFRYPAGFVYIFSALYSLTGQGYKLRVAQYIFAFIYLLNLALVIRICHKTAKVIPYCVCVLLECLNCNIMCVCVCVHVREG